MVKMSICGQECFDQRSLQKKNREKINSTSKVTDVGSSSRQICSGMKDGFPNTPHSIPPHPTPTLEILFVSSSFPPTGFHPFLHKAWWLDHSPSCFQLNHLFAYKTKILNFCTNVTILGGVGIGVPLHYGMIGSIPGLSPLDVSIMLSYSPNNKKYLQILPNVLPRQIPYSHVEHHCCRHFCPLSLPKGQYRHSLPPCFSHTACF